ncbi:hypothetical protein LTR53_000297 [Teratosphaeriaceae sp. CCFEE 6253]|nr:hypothetical protein LTR53_000297 [Teratosphaeriaceae sp. CCFEE 6253]
MVCKGKLHLKCQKIFGQQAILGLHHLCVGRFAESTTSTIRLEAVGAGDGDDDDVCDDPVAIAHMMNFFYVSNLTPLHSDKYLMVGSARVLAAAINYEAPVLHTLAAEASARNVDSRRESDVGDLAEAIQVVCTATPEGRPEIEGDGRRGNASEAGTFRACCDPGRRSRNQRPRTRATSQAASPSCSGERSRQEVRWV